MLHNAHTLRYHYCFTVYWVLALMIHAVLLLLRRIPFSAMLLSHGEKGPSELIFPLPWTTNSLSLHRSGVIFLLICHFALFPVFLQACPFVTRWMWVMHHTCRCQTFPSGPLVHRSALREPHTHFDLLTCLCTYICSINLCMGLYIFASMIVCENKWLQNVALLCASVGSFCLIVELRQHQ